MLNRKSFAVGSGLLTIMLFSLGAASDDPVRAPAQAHHSNKGDGICDSLYSVLVSGGSLYAGVVKTVTVDKVELQGQPFQARTERGTIAFQVQATLLGKSVGDLTIPFWWTEEPKGRSIPVADWGGHRSAWSARPKAGERLVLLIEKTDNWPMAEGPVGYRWEVSEDNRLVSAFRELGRFLRTKDNTEKRSIFRSMCRSESENVRRFAIDAVFGSEDGLRWTIQDGDQVKSPVSRSRAVISLLTELGSRIGPDVRAQITDHLSAWLSRPEWHLIDDLTLTKGQAATVADWFIAELREGTENERYQTLGGLRQILWSRGAAFTVAVFGKRQDQLLQQLHALRNASAAENPERSVRYLSQAILDTVRFWSSTFDALKKGGNLYVGTVRSVTVTPVNKRSPAALHTEEGVFQFRVKKTLNGRIESELAIPFWWTEGSETDIIRPMVSDNEDVWPARPTVGDRLLLLVGGADEQGSGDPRRKKGSVLHRWLLVGNDDPFAKEVETVVKFLNTKDKEEKRRIFRTMFESKSKNTRMCVVKALFCGGGDTSWFIARDGKAGPEVGLSRMVLEFLDEFGPKLDNDERQYITLCFSDGLVAYPAGVTEDLKNAFGEWIREELKIGWSEQRALVAIRGLQQILSHHGPVRMRDVLGNHHAEVMEALASIPRGGRSPELEKQSADLLAKINGP
jgi:hypothetical protein